MSQVLWQALLGEMCRYEFSVLERFNDLCGFVFFLSFFFAWRVGFRAYYLVFNYFFPLRKATSLLMKRNDLVELLMALTSTREV